MKMMKHTRTTLIAAIMAASVLTACQNEDPIQKVEEGLPVSISFNVAVPQMEDVTVTRATEEQETKIEKMAILFYDAAKENSKPFIVKVNNLGEPTKTNSTTNWLYTINLDENQLDGVYSGTWYMYPIANYDKYAVVDLDDLAEMTREEFKKYTITASGRDITSTAVMMSGHYGTTNITLTPGENTFEDVFHLRRVVSKNIFKFVNGTGVTFTPTKYSIYNYSTSCTLLERDAVTSYAGKNVFTKAENLPVSGNEFFFYMPENAQVATTAPTSWTYADRDRRNSDDYSTFTYAPAKATYVVVEGTYSGPGENGEGTVTGTVKYTIHLGNFGSSVNGGDFNNFIVKRNSKYTYTITVNGVNSIIAEAKQEGETQPGAEGQIVNETSHVVVELDSHYENVLLTLPKSAVTNYSISVSTPYDNFIYNGTSNNAKAVNWVKFGKPASTTTFSNYPGDANVTDIYGLVDALKNVDSSSDYYLVSGDKVYVQAYVDEYFYSDKEIGTFVDADDRTLSFTVGTAQVSKDKQSSYVEGAGFTLKQKSIKTFYNSNVSNPFGIEYVEETPEATLGTSDNYAGEELQNGLKNTKEIIGDNASWGTYVNISANGYNGATAPVAANIMTTAGNNPMYQCLSRNRDLDGNGVIDEDEVRWYLPAFRQYLYIWFGKKVLPTEISFNKTNYVSSSSEGYRVWWALEGTAISSWDAFLNDMGANSKTVVRCVRNLGTTSTDGNVSSVSSWNETQRTVTITGLKDESLRPSTQVGEYPEHENSAAASTLPKAFKIASKNLTIPGDGYTPAITVGTLDPTGIAESSNTTTNHNITVPVTITNYDASKSYSYKVGDGTETAVTSSTFKITVTIDWSGSGSTSSTSTTVQVKSANGNYSYFDVTVRRTRSGNGNNRKYTYTYSNSTPTQTTVDGSTADKTGFAYTEIMTGSLCEKNYYEESDKSDLGKWRIPNEKELYFIQLYCSREFDLGSGGDETDKDYVGARTKYPRSNTAVPYMIYYLMKDGHENTPIISTGDGQSGMSFKVRCVRDTEAASANTEAASANYDTLYSSGGNGFGI
jgi:hypothetical protein